MSQPFRDCLKKDAARQLGRISPWHGLIMGAPRVPVIIVLRSDVSWERENNDEFVVVFQLKKMKQRGLRRESVVDTK